METSAGTAPATRPKNSAGAWLGILIAFGFGAWMTWRATSQIWFPPNPGAPSAASAPSSDADSLPASTSAPAASPSDRAAAAEAKLATQLICIEAARKAAAETRVQASDVLAQLERLDPLSNPNRAKCKRLLNRLKADGLVEDDRERGFDLTPAGAQKLADWRSNRR